MKHSHPRLLPLATAAMALLSAAASAQQDPRLIVPSVRSMGAVQTGGNPPPVLAKSRSRPDLPPATQSSPDTGFVRIPLDPRGPVPKFPVTPDEPVFTVTPIDPQGPAPRFPVVPGEPVSTTGPVGAPGIVGVRPPLYATDPVNPAPGVKLVPGPTPVPGLIVTNPPPASTGPVGDPGSTKPPPNIVPSPGLVVTYPPPYSTGPVGPADASAPLPGFKPGR